MATKAQLAEQLTAANDELVRAGRTIEELRTQIARLRPVGYSQSRLPLERRADAHHARITTEQRRSLAPAYFKANPGARSVTDEELSAWAAEHIA